MDLPMVRLQLSLEHMRHQVVNMMVTDYVPNIEAAIKAEMERIAHPGEIEAIVRAEVKSILEQEVSRALRTALWSAEVREALRGKIETATMDSLAKISKEKF